MGKFEEKKGSVASPNLNRRLVAYQEKYDILKKAHERSENGGVLTLEETEKIKGLNSTISSPERDSRYLNSFGPDEHKKLQDLETQIKILEESLEKL